MKEQETEVCTMESSDDTDGNETDGSVTERCLFISSAANIRRRELHGQGRYYQQEENEVIKKKKKLIKKKPSKKANLASLKEMKEKIQEAIGADARGLKKKNPKRAVASIEKWENSGIWEEIVREGNEASKDVIEAVRLLHVPNTTPVGMKDPEPPPGFKRLKYEAKTGGKMFRKLLNISTQLFQKIERNGKNLSSMTTEVTILGDASEVDVKKAAINGLQVKAVKDRMLVQTHGIVDTGADTNCTDKKLRS